MNWNDLTAFSLFLLVGGLANYVFAEAISRGFRPWLPDFWDSEPDCQRITGKVMSAMGLFTLAVTTVTG